MSAAPQDVSRVRALLPRSSALRDQLSVTAVDVGAADALARYGAVGLGASLTIAQALGVESSVYPRSLALAVVVARPPWTFVVEPSGTRGTRTETLSRLSDGATAVNVFWNVNFRTGCRYWENQEELASFDLVEEEPRPLSDPRLERLRRGLTFTDPARCKAEALVLLERITGARTDWTTTSHPAAVVTDPDRFTSVDPTWLLSTRAPDLGDVEPAGLDDLAARAVDAACGIAGVDRGSLVEQRDALLTLARDLDVRYLIALVRSLDDQMVDPDEFLHKAEAVAAVRARLADDVAERTAGALVHAIAAVPGGWRQLKRILDRV
ncbi:DUF6461 domain-containing protein [Lentzea rhizosphaerae]|uniref:DUF6461 domain-containing protein n=1 Tax=Lentzea rhizosphaerae TaxID=2041025 RepID=A0ABV8BST6_9PSEU